MSAISDLFLNGRPEGCISRLSGGGTTRLCALPECASLARAFHNQERGSVRNGRPRNSR